ncbi:hypothetical protein VPH35_021221 [Triticum aestivum]
MDISHAVGGRHQSPPSTIRHISGREPDEAEPSRPDLRVTQRHNRHHWRSSWDHQPQRPPPPNPRLPAAPASASPCALHRRQEELGRHHHRSNLEVRQKFDPDNRFSSMSLHSAALLCSFLILTKDVVSVNLCT